MKLKEGDLFEIKIADNIFSYGQIISTFKKKALTIVIFEGQYTERPNVNDIINEKILLFGNTFDAKFYHGDWIAFDNNKSNLSGIRLPYYKIGIDPIYVEDFYENKIRKANKDDINKLKYRDYIAPVRLESALKAYYKYLDWNEVFDELLYDKLVLDFR